MTQQRRTLGDYRQLAEILGGPNTAATRFFDDKIKAQSADTPVLADEFQMMQLLATLLRQKL